MCVCRTREWQEAVKGRCAMRAVKSLGVRLLLKFNTKTLQKEKNSGQLTIQIPFPCFLIRHQRQDFSFLICLWLFEFRRLSPVLVGHNTTSFPAWSRKPELGHSCRVPANAWRSDFWLLFGEFDAKTLQKGITGSLTIHSIFFLLDATRKISDFFLFSSSSPAALASACGSQYDFIPCVIPQAGAGPFMPWPRQCLEVRYLIIFQKIWRKNLAERNQHSESYNPFDFFSSSSSPAALASACGSQYDFIPSWSRKPELGHSCRVPANAWRSDFWLFFGEFDAKTLQKGINSGSFTIHSIFSY